MQRVDSEVGRPEVRTTAGQFADRGSLMCEDMGLSKGPASIMRTMSGSPVGIALRCNNVHGVRMHEVCGLAVRAVWVGHAQCMRVAQQTGHVSVRQCTVHAVQCAVVGRVFAGRRDVGEEPRSGDRTYIARV